MREEWDPWRMGTGGPEGQAYKAILIVGGDHNISNDIRKLYKQQGYLLIGDGRNSLDSLDLTALQGRVDKNTRIDIWAHGLAIDNNHDIDGISTKAFLEKVASYNEGIPLNIHLHACYAGAAAPNIIVLPNGSMLVTHGPEDDTTIVSINARTILQSNQNLRVSLAQDIADRFLMNTKQTTTISIKRQDGSIFQHTIRMPRHLLTIPDEIIRYFEKQRLEFVDKYNHAFGTRIDVALLPAITPEEAMEWRSDNFITIANTRKRQRLIEALEHGGKGIGELLKYMNYSVGEQPVLMWAVSQGHDHVVTALLSAPEIDIVIRDNGVKRKLSANELQVLRGASAAAVLAVMKYSLDFSKVKDAPCFSSAASPTALAYIQNAYNQGQSDADKQTNARSIFESIKDLDNPFHITAVVEFGLDLKQIKGALCFSPAAGDAALYYIHETMREARLNGEEGKVNAQRVFESIKDLDNPFRIKAVIEFGFDREQVKSALCFNPEAYDTAVRYLEEAYSREPADAQRIFDIIKDLDNRFHIDAAIEFIKLGLDPEQVKGASCFNLDTYDTAMRYLQEAYSREPADAQRIFDIIKSLDNRFHIYTAITFVEWGLDPKQVKSSSCFNNPEAYDTAMRYLQEAYSKGQNEAQRVFDIIKDLDNRFHMEAALGLVEFGLDSKQVKGASCFSLSAFRHAINCIHTAYSSGGSANAQRIFGIIKDLDNRSHIDAALRFVELGLDPKQVKSSSCFNQDATNRMSMNFIKQAYDQGQSDVDKQARAQKAFESIKNLNNPQHIVAVSMFGLDPKQVKGALCFGPATSTMIISIIRQAYDRGQSDVDKQANAQRVFESIKDLDNPVYMKVVSEHALSHNNEQVNNPYHIIATTVFGLDSNQVKTAPCFNSAPDISAQALARIYKAYNEGNSPHDKEANAKEAFAQIQVENLIDILDRTEAFDWSKMASAMSISDIDNDMIKSEFKKLMTNGFINGGADATVPNAAGEFIKDFSQKQEDKVRIEEKPQNFQERVGRSNQEDKVRVEEKSQNFQERVGRSNQEDKVRVEEKPQNFQERVDRPGEDRGIGE